MTPKTIDNVPTGTRLCAYWSQQYRCLYPGKAIDSENYDETSGFVSVEFDDGDSGKIRLENIRLLLSDYPVVGKFAFNNRCIETYFTYIAYIILHMYYFIHRYRIIYAIQIICFSLFKGKNCLSVSK